MGRFGGICVIDNEEVPGQSGGGGQCFRRAQDHWLIWTQRRGRFLIWAWIEKSDGQMEPPGQFIMPAAEQ